MKAIEKKWPKTAEHRRRAPRIRELIGSCNRAHVSHHSTAYFASLQPQGAKFRTCSLPSRLDREEVKPQLELTDLAELITHLADQYEERWTDRKLSLSKDVPAAEVLADAELLRLAVRQLLDNACKYSHSGAVVKIGIAKQHEVVTVRVWNSGNPVPVNERPRIFERFYRGTDARQVAPGSGLGLYVARKIIQAHGGSLDLESDDTPNSEGVSFRLTMPIAKGDSDPV